MNFENKIVVFVVLFTCKFYILLNTFKFYLIKLFFNKHVNQK